MTDREGRYSFSGLFPGSHRVEVETDAMSFDRREYTDVMIAAAEKILEREGICDRDEAVIMVAGIPPNQHASTNLMKVHVIGEREWGAMSQKMKRPSADVGGY